MATNHPIPVSYLTCGEAEYPQCLAAIADGPAPRLAMLGEASLLGRASLGVLCSIKCPGNLILRTYDFIEALKDQGQAVVGGFHSPMEQECLRLLLRNNHPVIIFVARGIQRKKIAKNATNVQVWKNIRSGSAPSRLPGEPPPTPPGRQDHSRLPVQSFFDPPGILHVLTFTPARDSCCSH